MYVRLLSFGLLTLMAAPAYCQISKFEPTKVEGQKALKLITVRGNTYGVAAMQSGFEDALALAVGHRHALDNCSGALAITKTRVIYNSPTRPDHSFNLARTDFQAFEVNNWRSFGKTVYQQITAKTKGKDYNFFPWADSAIYNFNWEDYPHVLNWFGMAMSNFDVAWKTFHETYNQSVPKDTLIDSRGRFIQILERYDKFKDRTTYATSAMQMKGSHYGTVFLATFSCEGEIPSRPKNAILYIDADDTVRRLFKSDRSLIFLIDGARLKLGEMEWLDSTYIPGGRYYAGSVIDELGIAVPWEILKKIANGLSVEFQVGTVEAKLDTEHKEALKKLISRAESGGSQKQ